MIVYFYVIASDNAEVLGLIRLHGKSTDSSLCIYMLLALGWTLNELTMKQLNRRFFICDLTQCFGHTSSGLNILQHFYCVFQVKFKLC